MTRLTHPANPESPSSILYATKGYLTARIMQLRLHLVPLPSSGHAVLQQEYNQMQANPFRTSLEDSCFVRRWT